MHDTHATEDAAAALVNLVLRVERRLNVTASGRRDAHLTMQEYCVLNALRSGLCHVGTLRNFLGVHAVQMTRILRRLEKGGSAPLIQCAINREDRRRIDVTLTTAGKRALQKFRRSRLAPITEAINHLDDQTCRCLLAAIEQLRETLQKT